MDNFLHALYKSVKRVSYKYCLNRLNHKKLYLVGVSCDKVSPFISNINHDFQRKVFKLHPCGDFYYCSPRISQKFLDKVPTADSSYHGTSHVCLKFCRFLHKHRRIMGCKSSSQGTTSHLYPFEIIL